MTHQKTIDLEQERRLNQAIKQLASEEQTAHDLWPSIKSKIQADVKTSSSESASSSAGADSVKVVPQKNVETKLFARSWNSWAIAASLVICVGSVSYSWMQLEKADAIYAEVNQIQQKLNSNLEAASQTASGSTVSLKPASKENSDLLPASIIDSREVNADYYVRQVDAMEKEFKAAKASLMARIAMNRANISEALLTQVETELMEIERATLVLKKAMGRQQVDANFTNLLRLTYQQELTILTQLAKFDTTI